MKPTSVNLDLTELELPHGSVFRAKNVVVNKKYGSYSNEDGMIKSNDLTSHVIGGVKDDEGGAILFQTNDITSEIGIEDKYGVYSTIIKDTNLGFKRTNPIRAVFSRNSQGQRIVAWCDGINDDSNDIRSLNLDDLPFSLTGTALTNPDDVALLNLFPKIATPHFTVVDVPQTSGSLLSGVYYFIMSYVLDDTSLSNPVGLSYPVPIIDDVNDPGINAMKIDGAAAGTSTTKAIQFQYSGLSDLYDKVSITVISKIDGILTAKSIGEYSYSNGVVNITYTGSEQHEEVSLDSVIIPSAIYKGAEDMTISQTKLTIISPKTRKTVDFQKYANNIKVKWTKDISGYVYRPYNSSTDETWANAYRGFRSDEVYALYIHLNFTDGSKSEAFHIPGRAANIGEDALITNTADEGYIASDGKGRYFHFNDTSLSNGNMSFWQNEDEFYPNTDDFNSTSLGGEDLRGKRVRHHKFPSLSKLKDYGHPFVHRVSSTNSDPEIEPLGIKLENVVIPDEIRPFVDSFELTWAKRDLANSTIVGQSAIHNHEIYQYSGNRNDIVEFRMYPFEILRQILPITATHIITETNVRDNVSWQNSKSSGVLMDGLNTSAIASNAFFQNRRKVRSISDTKILLPDSENTGTLNYGREGCYYGKLNTPTTLEAGYTDIPPDIDSNHTREYEITNLCVFRSNVYNKFTTQDLVRTNMIHKVSPSTSTYNTNAIYGGDTYICAYTYRTKSIYFGSFTPIDYNYTYLIPVETTSNIAFRHNGPGQEYYSNIADINLGSPDHYTYNDDYSSINDLIPVFIQDTFQKERNVSTLFYRVARSQPQGTESGDLRWRQFLGADYYEMPKNTGKLTAVTASNRELFIHSENTLYVAIIKDRLEFNDAQTAFLGDADLFDRDPDDVLPTQEGFFGCHDKYATLLCKLGYVWINVRLGKLFIKYHGGTIKEESRKGIINWLRDNCRNLGTNATENGFRNPFIGSGITMGYDEDNNRLFITKIDDQAPPQENILFSLGKNFTISFSPEVYGANDNDPGGIICHHDFYPNFWFTKLEGIYAVKNIDYGNADTISGLSGGAGIYRHGVGEKGKYFGDVYESYVDVIFNSPKRDSKVLESVSWISEVADGLKKIYNKTFTHAIIYNDHRCSGRINLKDFYLENHRNAEGHWNFNDFRDIVVDPNEVILDADFNINESNLDDNVAWFKKGRFIGKYFIVRLICDNVDNLDYNLIDIDVNVTQSDR